MADEEVSEEKLLGPEVNAVQDSTLGRQIILSLCPPIRSPPLVTSISSDPFWSWLSDKDAFKAWIDSATRGTRILHLQGNVSNVAYFSNQVFSGLYEDLTSRGRQTPIFHFRFHRHDCRYNNTQALMTSFLAQLVSRSSAFAIRKVARIANFIRREQALCLTDLIQLFEDMRQTDECEGFYWMISCIEECVDQGLGQVFRAFRQRSITNEQTFKVIVTGRDNDNGKNLEGFPLIDLDSFPSTAYYRAAHNARYGATQEALVGLAETQTEFEDDVPLKAMATEWLEARRVGLASNQNALTLLPESANLSQTAIFRILAEPVPPSLQDLRATAISLVRYAIRPLTVQELASALAMNEMAGSRQAGEGVAFSWTVQRLTQSFQEMVPGQFVVKHNEVHFAHGDSAEDASDTTFAESHRDIVKRCLQYLNLPSSISEMKQFVCELYDTEIPVTPTRNSFTAYAVQYFPHHYKRSGLARPLEDVFGFFHDRGNMLSWSEAHYALANVSTRVHCGYSSMLPILSRTGLLDLVEEYLRRESGSKEYDSTKHRADWSLAIIEACRLGDVPLVRFLIKVSRPNATELSTAIIAAVSNGDSELIEYLIDEISALKGLDQWPEDEGWADDTLFRVAWLGQQEAVKKLIALDININPKPESMRFEGPPLFISIRGKSQAVVEMLLAAGADTTITAPWGDERALTKAARWGEPEFVDILLHHEPAKARERGELNEALQLACEFAAFASMRTLLEAGADPNMKAWEDDEGFETPLFCCASHGYVQCVQILLQHKADVNFTVPNSTALLQAVHNDLIELARMLLIHGAEPNLTTELIELPLIIAADRDNVAMVELLLDHHADIEKESETNDLPNTPLAVAARYSGMEVIRCLMRRGADINHVGKRSCSPFWSACWRKPPQLELVKELLEAGADINAPSGDPTVLNWSPIHAAYDFPEILATLLGAGAKINQISADSSTVLYLASKWNHQDSVHTLLAYKGKDEIEIDREIFDEPDTEHGMTPLCIACQKGHVGIMRLLLEAGANPAHRMPTGGFPLLLCLEADVDGKDIEHTVRMLLEYLPCDKLNQRDNDGNTALHTIRAAHQVPVVRCLVNMGADMSAQNNKGFTPFQRAIHVDNPEVAAYLLSKGADIHADSSGTGSPLRLACRAASLRMMKLLIEAGAEVNEQDKTTGESILQTCIVDGSRDKVELVQYLVEDRKVDVNVGGGHFKYPIINNARTDYIDSDIVATLLVHNGADVNAKDDAGRRVIHHSMLQETHFLTEELLGLGAEIEALDALGRNALHYAAASGNVHLVGRILASDHISVDLADGDGWTPLMWACRGRKEHSFDTICGMLLGRGASPWARGSGQYDEWSPLKTARYFNRASKSADSIMAQLEPSGEQRKIEEGFEVWNDDFHRTRKGWDEETPLCSGCFSVSSYESGAVHICNEATAILTWARFVTGSVGAAKQSPSALTSTCALFVTCIGMYCIHSKVTVLEKSERRTHLILSLLTARGRMMMLQVKGRIETHVKVATLQMRRPMWLNGWRAEGPLNHYKCGLEAHRY